MERQDMLRKQLSKKIMKVLADGLKDDFYLSDEEKQISYIEAVDVLQYTISEVQKRPVLF